MSDSVNGRLRILIDMEGSPGLQVNATPDSGAAAVAARQALVRALELLQQVRLALGRIGGDLPAVVRRLRGAAIFPAHVLLQAGLDGGALAAGVAVVDQLVVLPQRNHPGVVRGA